MQHHHHASDDHDGVSGLGDVTCRYGCETAACGQPGIMPEKGGRQRTNAHHVRVTVRRTKRWQPPAVAGS